MTLGRLVLIVFALGILIAVVGGKSSGSEFGWNQALSLCQQTIGGMTGGDVPYVDRHGSGDEYYFAWGASTKFIRVNGAAVSASCIVDGKTKGISQLTLNGKTIL